MIDARKKRAHTAYLEAASDALFQDRERHRAAGEPWPEALEACHAAIRREMAAREKGGDGGKMTVG